MDLRIPALVALGGGAGSLLRYGVNVFVARQHFPFSTLLVNVAGCFLLGFLLYGGTVGGWMTPQLRGLVGVGLLGGFTTMSAFALETVELVDEGHARAAVLNVLVTVALSLLGAAAGRWAGLRAWG